MSAHVVVTALYQYPVKSCRGLAMSSLQLDAIGPVGDRRFMLIDGNARFVSQRTQPRLAQVAVAWTSDGLALTAPGQAPLHVGERRTGEEPRTHVQIWRDAVWTYDLGDEAADYFSRYLGAPVRLVHLPDESARWVDSDFAKQPARVGLADGFPLLVATEESLTDLNTKMERALPMNRFRPNLVVKGAPAWDEDEWTLLRATRAGGVDLAVVKPCSRCNTTTVDQDTAHRGLEPLRTLAGFRRRDNQVFFGENLLHSGPGTIAVGDRFEIIK